MTLELQAAAPAIARELESRKAASAPVRRVHRGWYAAGGLAAVAAALAVAVLPFGAAQVASQTYVTGKGEHRTLRLEDGSTVEMNGGTTLTVALAKHERRLSLPEGEAVFDVAPDKARPFLIAAGDRTVRVVGTRFDVRERSGDLTVTVERGVVEVHSNDPTKGAAFRLHPGQRLRQLVAAVDELAPQMGRAFRLHKLEGLSHAETAAVMGLSVKAVEKHVSAALKALTRKLAP